VREGGHVPPKFVVEGTVMMFVSPEFSTIEHIIMYLTARYAVYYGRPCVVMGRSLYFAGVVSFFFIFPRLFSAVGHWMSTIPPHMTWL